MDKKLQGYIDKLNKLNFKENVQRRLLPYMGKDR